MVRSGNSTGQRRIFPCRYVCYDGDDEDGHQMSQILSNLGLYFEDFDNGKVNKIMFHHHCLLTFRDKRRKIPFGHRANMARTTTKIRKKINCLLPMDFLSKW